MYSKLLTSVDPEKIAQYIDQKDEYSFVFFNLGTGKNCCKICDDTKFGWCDMADLSKLKENNDREEECEIMSFMVKDV